jgi:hypothetical protein
MVQEKIKKKLQQKTKINKASKKKKKEKKTRKTTINLSNDFEPDKYGLHHIPTSSLHIRHCGGLKCQS